MVSFTKDRKDGPTPLRKATQAPRSESETNDTWEMKAKLVYPINGSTITESKPTIIGKVNQPTELLLNSEYKKDNFLHFNTNEIDYGINFYPGDVNNIIIKLDENIIDTAHGFPQFPYILCGSADDKNQVWEREECIRNQLADLPPVIFFIKPKSNLSPGEHHLTVNVGGKKFDYQFNVDLEFQLPKQSLPKQVSSQYFIEKFSFINRLKALFDQTVYAGHDNPVRNKLNTKLKDLVKNESDYINASDSCPRGYHYQKNLLPMPLPSNTNKNIYYEIYLPFLPEHLGLKPSRKVSIKFDNVIYDLKFTDFNNFYFEEETTPSEYKDYVKAGESLYMPIENLIFAQSGESLESGVSPNDYELPVAFNYTEYLPNDYSGRVYKNNLLLYRTINSSSCDG